MRELIFIEGARDAWAVKARAGVSRGASVVALTAEAAQAADEAGVGHHLASEYANTFALADVDDDLNAACLRLAQSIDRYMGDTLDPLWSCEPGPLTCQSYYLQYSVSAILKRVHLMREVIRAIAPDRVTCFEQPTDPWFAPDGYSINPWMLAMAHAVEGWSRLCELLPYPNSTAPRANFNLSIATRSRRTAEAVVRRALGTLAGLSRRVTTLSPEVDFAGFRMLLVGRFTYDWEPVAAAIGRSAQCFRIAGTYMDARPWTLHYLPVINSWNGQSSRTLNITPPQAVSAADISSFSERLCDWADVQPGGARLTLLGIDLWPAVLTHVSAVASQSLALVRHTDAIATALLDEVRPHVICFPSMPNLADIRLGAEAHARGIPVVSYQHGFGYGIQLQAKDEQIETRHADYFFTYGNGIQPRIDGPFPPRAVYVAIGSTRVASMVSKRGRESPRRSARPSILWIAESTTRNTHVTSLTEDTLRFSVERRGLRVLSELGTVRLTYRPYVHCMEIDGVSRFLRTARLRDVQIDVVRPLEALIARSDLVVVYTSSPTTWAEVIALDRPMILACDPRQTRLTPSFVPELEKVCHWCKNADDFLATLRTLAENPQAFINQERTRARRDFLSEFVLGPPEGAPVSRAALALLNSVRSGS